MNTFRKLAVSAVAVGAAITGGAIGASVVGTAGAQTDSSSSSSTASDSAATAPDPSQGGHTANGITEALLTGDAATQVTAAAQAAVPGATDRVENDAEGATYEAHVTKSDGSKVTVKINADFSIAGIEDGMR